FAECAHIIRDDTPLVVQGALQNEEEGEAKIIADTVDTLADALKKFTAATRIMLFADRVNRRKIEDLKKAIHRHHGPCPVSLTLHFPKRGEADIDIPEELTINPGREFSREVDDILGYGAIQFIKKQPETARKNGKRGNFQPAG
ncbi:MAG: DNA polymerase III subunit alpha, partial [Thermodesulfobacteriota bacterium]